MKKYPNEQILLPQYVKQKKVFIIPVNALNTKRGKL